MFPSNFQLARDSDTTSLPERVVFPMSMTCSVMPLVIPGLDKDVLLDGIPGVNADEEQQHDCRSDAKQGLSYSDLREAMSMEKLYFTSASSSLSYASLSFWIGMTSTSAVMLCSVQMSRFSWVPVDRNLIELERLLRIVWLVQISDQPTP
jgi:hypothetical protein